MALQTALQFCTRRPAELLFIGDVLCDVLQAAVQHWGYNEVDVRYIALEKAFTGDIAKLVDTGYTDFFSSMAEGLMMLCM